MTNPNAIPDNKPSSLRFVSLAGLGAMVLFFTSLIGFAAVRTDGYTHGTKAISELGAVGAPNAMAFNFLGFILPGAMTILFSVALLKLGRREFKKAGPVLLMISGLGFMVAGLFPIDLSDRGSLTTILHAVGASFAGLFWGLGLFWIGSVLKRGFGLIRWGTATPWFVLFLVANFAWQGVWQATGSVLPGWGQRIAFGGFFGWLAITSWLVFRQLREA